MVEIYWGKFLGKIILGKFSLQNFKVGEKSVRPLFPPDKKVTTAASRGIAPLLPLCRLPPSIRESGFQSPPLATLKPALPLPLPHKQNDMVVHPTRGRAVRLKAQASKMVYQASMCRSVSLNGCRCPNQFDPDSLVPGFHARYVNIAAFL